MSGQAPDDEDSRSLKLLVRLLIVLAIAIPLVIEGATVVSLVGEQFGPEAPATATPVPERSVTEGDELLTETPQRERITEALVTVREEAWSFSLTVAVSNNESVPYELQVGPVQTGGGDTVSGRATTGQVAPGANTTLRRTWELPAGQRPASITVVALRYTDPVTRTDRTVNFGQIRVRG
jgi:hypothetical protein